jgi:competence protein ComEA
MKHRRTETVLLALVLWLAAFLAHAADAAPRPQGAASASPPHKVLARKEAAALLPVEPIDINSAAKPELKKLPGIGDAQADRIIAGRPYLSKAHLQTRNVLSPMEYQAVRERVVARQKDAKFGKAPSK